MLSALIAVFLMMLVGYLARRAGVLRSSDADVVRLMVTNITGPAFIFISIYGKAVNTDMIVAPAVHIVSLVITLGIAYAIARLAKLDRPTTGAMMLVAAFGNTGFLGYPVVDAAYPGDETARAAVVMVDQLGETICMYSIGIAVAMAFGSRKDEGYHPLGFLKTPLFLAMVVVFALRLPLLDQIHIPSFILVSGTSHPKGVFNYLGACTAPILLLAAGMLIKRMSLRPLIAPLTIAGLSAVLVYAVRQPIPHIPSFILVPEPHVLGGILNYIGDGTIPLAMLSLGLTISRVPIKSIFVPFIIACVLKFVGMPLLNLAGLHLTGVGGTVGQIAMLEAAMPAAIMTSVVAGRYGSNAKFASAAVFLMTLMSIGIIPLVLGLVK